jgi:hypothetical protein
LVYLLGGGIAVTTKRVVKMARRVRESRLRLNSFAVAFPALHSLAFFKVRVNSAITATEPVKIKYHHGGVGVAPTINEGGLVLRRAKDMIS